MNRNLNKILIFFVLLIFVLSLFAIASHAKSQNKDKTEKKKEINISGIEFDKNYNKSKSKLKINKTNYGKLKAAKHNVKVEFLKDIKSDKKLSEVTNKINITKNKLTIDSKKNDEFKNTTAKITFYNITYKNPLLLHNNQKATNAILFKESKTTYFTLVKSFSSYSITDNEFNGTFENSTVWAEGLGATPDAIVDMSFDDYGINETIIIDDSHYSTNATVLRKWITEGIVGNALDFHGDQTVTVGNKDSLDMGFRNFSIGAWVKANYTSSYRSIFDSGNLPSRWEIGLLSGTYFYAHTHDGSGPLTVSDNTDLSDEWHFVFAVFKRDENLTIYVDGVNVGTADMTGVDNLTSDQEMQIGSNQDTTNYFNGLIDHVMIFNCSIPASEILLANNTPGYIPNCSGGESGAISIWDLNESSGIIAADSNDGNNGNLLGWGRPDSDAGNISLGIRFYGDDDLFTFGDTSTLHFVRDLNFTVSLWAKMVSWTKPGFQAYLATAHGSGQNGFVFYYDGAGDYLKWNYISVGGTTTGTSTISDMGNSDWNHIVFIGNGTSINFYINGNYVASNSPITTLWTTNVTEYAPVVGGYKPSDPLGLYEGVMDEITIYDRSLTDSEILDLYENNTIRKYHKSFKYTSVIYNASDHDNGTTANVWIASKYDLNTCIFDIYGRAGPCASIGSEPYSIASWNGSHYVFGNQQGLCFQYYAIGTTDGENLSYCRNLTIESFKAKTPETVINWVNSGQNTSNDNIVINATFLLNDTDNGSLNFSWFIDDVPSNTYLVTGLANGDTATASLHGNFTSPTSRIHCVVTPITNTEFFNVTGQNVTSLTVNLTPVNPVITLNFPINGTGIDSDAVLNFTVNDADTDLFTVQIIGSSVSGGKANTTIATLYNQSDGDLNYTWSVGVGTWNWYVSVNDSYSITNSSNETFDRVASNQNGGSGGGGGYIPDKTVISWNYSLSTIPYYFYYGETVDIVVKTYDINNKLIELPVLSKIIKLDGSSPIVPTIISNGTGTKIIRYNLNDTSKLTLGLQNLQIKINDQTINKKIVVRAKRSTTVDFMTNFVDDLLQKYPFLNFFNNMSPIQAFVIIGLLGIVILVLSILGIYVLLRKLFTD